MTKRKRYSSELAKKYGVHPTMISGWQKTAIKNMAQAFGGTAEEAPPISPKGVERLHAKIGQLVVERDFFGRCSSLILGTGGGKR